MNASIESVHRVTTKSAARRNELRLRLVLTLAVVSTAVPAYAIGPVPLQWMSRVLFVALGVFAIVFSGETRPITKFLFAFGLFIGVAALSNWIAFSTGVVPPMPRLATTGHFAFVALRFFSLLTHVSTIAATYWLVRRVGLRPAAQVIANIGFLVAIAALYIYAAQLLGLPEPPRTRIGTTGGEQATTFSYAFHRAMGTFREPSHLAEWLILPICMSASIPGTRSSLRTMLLLGVLFLTGSLTGLLGLASALGLACILFRRYPRPRQALAVVFACSAALLMFTEFASLGRTDASLFDTLLNRITPILDSGMTASNRGHVYEFLADHSSPLLGFGLGNSNLLFSLAQGSLIVESFLSLYINAYFSTGLIGLVILLLALGQPLAYAARFRGRNCSRVLFTTGTAYLAWLVIAWVHTEEFHSLHSMTIGLLLVATITQRGRESDGNSHLQRLLPSGLQGGRRSTVAGESDRGSGHGGVVPTSHARS